MARKEAIFTAKVDTGSSVNDVKALEKEMVDLNDQMKLMEKNGETNTTAFKDLSKSFDNTQKDLKKLSGDMEHLGDVIGVEVSGSISKMEDRLYELALAGKTGSAEFVSLQEQTAKYKKIIIETDRSVDALAEQGRALSGALSISSTAVAGFQAYTGVTALLGTENEALLETITKLQAAQGVLNAIEQIKVQITNNSIKITKLQVFWTNALTLATGKGSKAMKIFRLAMISTGIGAIIIGLGLLIANFSKLSGWIQKGIKSFKEMGVGMKLLLYPITLLIKGYEMIMGALQSLGVIDSEETKKRIANAEKRVNALEKETEVIGDRYDFEISKAKAAGKNTYMLEQLKRQAFKKSTKLQIESIRTLGRLNKGQTDEQKEQIKELIKLIKLSDQETTVSRIAENKRKSDSDKAENKSRSSNAKTYRDKRIADAKKEQEELNKILMDQFAVEDEIFKLRLSAEDLQEQAVSDKYDALMLKAHGNAELEKQLIIQQESELATLRKGFADKTALDQATAIETANTLRHSLMRNSITEDIAILNEKYQAEREALQENELISSEEKIMLMGEILEREKAEEDLIRVKWNEKELADEKKKTDEKSKIRDAFFKVSMDSLNAMSDLNNLVTDLQLKKAQGNTIQEEKIRKKSFNRNKALQVNMAIITGIQSVMSGYAAGLSVGGPMGLVMGPVMAGVAGVTAAVNIAKIAAAKYEGGGGGGGASIPSASAGAGASASSFAISDDTSSVQTELNADGSPVDDGSGLNKVVVVETDITTAVNNVAKIDELSTF